MNPRRYLIILTFFVSAICLAGPKQPIPVPSYLDVNVTTITANEWKYFIGEVKPKKELEHPAKRVSASIDLNAEENRQRRKYLERVIETSIMELEIRDGHKLVTFTEIKPKRTDGKIEWSAEYGASQKFKVVLWLRYSYTEQEYPTMAEPIPLSLLKEWRAHGS